MHKDTNIKYWIDKLKSWYVVHLENASIKHVYLSGNFL